MREGDVIFDFSLPDLNGKPVSIREYRGKKVLIIMWASW
ncbi:peroxiredoxin family protein [Effusibacillus lacus]|nr:redoxin domain-containing protein [Effusibacillus lacus]TCS72067.1 AhpC/TSA family protein [Effusibacillus lacus]